MAALRRRHLGERPDLRVLTGQIPVLAGFVEGYIALHKRQEWAVGLSSEDKRARRVEAERRREAAERGHRFEDRDVTEEEEIEEEMPEGGLSPARQAARYYLRKLYLDLVGPTVEDIDGNTGAAITRDKDTGWPDVCLIRD